MAIRWGMRVGFLVSLAVFAAAGCGASRAQRSIEAAAPAASPAGAPASAPLPVPASHQPPRLVVALVLDQLGSDTLLKHLPWLHADGAIRQAITRGVYLEHSVYPYANTLTAPGHAAIHTGAPPSVSGVEGNSAWDAQKGGPVSCIEDVRHPVFGREPEGISAGPGRLLVPTVAHALKAQTGGVAKVISLSLKDRSAILSVGSAADLVLWFDSKLGAFTSSSAWGTALPAWVQRYQVEHPLTALLTPWLPHSERAYRASLGRDDAPGEGDLGGFGTTFPHGWERVAKPWSVLGCTPMLSEYLVSLAEAAVHALELGRDSVPDLVALSISGTDCTGHVFGPDSWEYVDHLVRADRAVGAWLKRLEQTTPIAVLITSDHGVAALPESRPGPAGRIFPQLMQARVEASVAAQFGSGPWVQGIVPPYVYLTPRAREHAQASQVLARALTALRKELGLRDAWPLSEVRQWASDPDPLRRSLELSLAPDTNADIMFLTLPDYPIDLRDPEAKGTNHGTPYAYDRQVPVLAWGSAVPRRRQSEPVDQLRVAATLAHLLGVAPPAQAAAGALL